MIVSIVLNLSTPFAISAQNNAAIISDLDWNPNGKQIAIGISATGTDSTCVNFQNIQILDVSTSQLTSIPRPNNTCSITNVDYSPDGSQLLTTSDGYLEIWNMVTGERLQAIAMENIFQHAFWNPNGTGLLDVLAQGLQFRKATDLSKVSSGFIAPGRLENKLFTYSAWSPDGSSVAVSATDGKIYIWDVANKTILRVFDAHSAPVRRLAWSSALNLIASGDDSGKIIIWNPTSGEIAAELDGHTGAIRDIDWRVDGQQLASTAADNTVRTWTWPSGEANVVENNQSIWSVAYSPDGNQLAYGGDISDSRNVVAQIMVTSSIVATSTPTF